MLTTWDLSEGIDELNQMMYMNDELEFYNYHKLNLQRDHDLGVTDSPFQIVKSIVDAL